MCTISSSRFNQERQMTQMKVCATGPNWNGRIPAYFCQQRIYLVEVNGIPTPRLAGISWQHLPRQRLVGPALIITQQPSYLQAKTSSTHIRQPDGEYYNTGIS